ncbi:MAG: hypothetical protein M1830_008662 [Pleopsidium flavum]|nr:MAG: hypothetical protein M1830_008662 [Pleopsidium flavum]
MVEVGLLMLDEMVKMRQTIKGALDVLRAATGLATLDPAQPIIEEGGNENVEKEGDDSGGEKDDEEFEGDE